MDRQLQNLFIPNPAVCVALIISSSTIIGVYNRLGSPGNKTTGWIAACFTDIGPTQLLVYTVVDRASMLDHITFIIE